MIKNYSVKNTSLGFCCWQNFIILLFSMFSLLFGQTSSINENTATITYPKVQVTNLAYLPIGNRTGDFHDPELVGTLTTPSIRVPMSVAWDGESTTLVFDISLRDIHFFEPQTGWGCAGNSVFRYN